MLLLFFNKIIEYLHSVFVPPLESQVSTTFCRSQVVLNAALRERHMGYLHGLKWDDAVAKSLDSFRGFDIFKLAEGSDPDSRNQELPVSLKLIVILHFQ